MPNRGKTIGFKNCNPIFSEIDKKAGYAPRWRYLVIDETLLEHFLGFLVSSVSSTIHFYHLG